MKNFRPAVRGMGAARLGLISVTMIFALVVLGSTAQAGTVDTGVVSYTDETRSFMLGTASDVSHKSAMIQFQTKASPGAPAIAPYQAFFGDAGEWGKFVALWDTARASTADGAADKDIGSYFDSRTSVIVGVSKNTDGSITFTSYNGSDAILVTIAADQIDGLDAYFKKITAYFAD